MRSCRIWNGNCEPPARKRAMPYAANTPTSSANSVPRPAARKLFLSGVSAEKSCVAKMLSFGSLIPRTSLKFVSVHSEGHQTVTPGGFSSAFVLKAIVITQ